MQKQTVEDIKEKVAPILREAGVKNAALFGSVARGEATEKSDVDILIDTPRGMTLFGFIGLEHKLEEILGKEVDLVERTTIKPSIKQYILGDQIQIL